MSHSWSEYFGLQHKKGNFAAVKLGLNYKSVVSRVSSDVNEQNGKGHYVVLDLPK